MASLSPADRNRQEETDFATLIADAQAEIDEDLRRSGLGRDPYAWILSAQSLVLSILPRFVKEISQAKEPWTTDERREIVRAAAKDMRSEVGRLVGAEQYSRTIAAGIAGAVLVLVGIGCGYLAGQHGKESAVAAAEARAVKIEGDLSAAAAKLTQDQAEVWSIVMRENSDIRATVPAPCPIRDEQQGGRTYCWARLWTEPAKPPTPSAPPATAPTEAPASRTITGRKSG